MTEDLSVCENKDAIEKVQDTINRIGGELTSYSSDFVLHEKLYAQQNKNISDTMQTMNDNFVLLSQDIKNNYVTMKSVEAMRDNAMLSAKNDRRVETTLAIKDYDISLRNTIKVHLIILWSSALIFSGFVSYIYLNNKTETNNDIKEMTADRYTSETAKYQNGLVNSRIDRLKLKVKSIAGRTKDIEDKIE